MGFLKAAEASKNEDQICHQKYGQQRQKQANGTASNLKTSMHQRKQQRTRATCGMGENTCKSHT